jgi:hypothetical protein
VGAGEHTRKENAVVGAVWLLAEHHDFERAAVALASTFSASRAPAIPFRRSPGDEAASRAHLRDRVCAYGADLELGMRLIGSSAAW